MRLRAGRYNATRIPNQKQPFDLNACPDNFPHRAWTPWLNSTPPLPGPKPKPPPAPPGVRASVAPVAKWSLDAKAGVVTATGWCCDPLLANGTGHSTIQFVRGGAAGTKEILGKAVADHPRKQLVAEGDCVTNDHGFVFPITLAKLGPAAGKYSLIVRAARPDGTEVIISKGQLCIYGDGKPCSADVLGN